MTTKELIGIADAAAILGLTRGGVQRRISDGRMSPLGRVGERGTYVFERDAVEALAQASLKGSRHG